MDIILQIVLEEPVARMVKTVPPVLLTVMVAPQKKTKTIPLTRVVAARAQQLKHLVKVSENFMLVAVALLLLLPIMIIMVAAAKVAAVTATSLLV